MIRTTTNTESIHLTAALRRCPGDDLAWNLRRRLHNLVRRFLLKGHRDHNSRPAAAAAIVAVAPEDAPINLVAERAAAEAPEYEAAAAKLDECVGSGTPAIASTDLDNDLADVVARAVDGQQAVAQNKQNKAPCLHLHADLVGRREETPKKPGES